MVNECIDYLVGDILNSLGASGNQIGAPKRKEFACVVLFIITTLHPSVLWCFLCPCHELLSVILPNPVTGQQNVARQSRCNKDWMAQKAEIIFSLVLCRRYLLTPALEVGDIRPVYRREKKGLTEGMFI